MNNILSRLVTNKSDYIVNTFDGFYWFSKCDDNGNVTEVISFMPHINPDTYVMTFMLPDYVQSDIVDFVEIVGFLPEGKPQVGSPMIPSDIVITEILEVLQKNGIIA